MQWGLTFVSNSQQLGTKILYVETESPKLTNAYLTIYSRLYSMVKFFYFIFLIKSNNKIYSPLNLEHLELQLHN